MPVKKQFQIIMISFLFFIFAFSIGSAISTNSEFHSLNYNPNILYVGGSGPYNYTTIQQALTNATNGDTIFVYDDSSPYNEHLIITIPISLKGENPSTTHIIGIDFEHIIEIRASDISIEGFTFTTAENITTKAAIYIENQRNIIIQNNHICQNPGYGIQTASSDNLQLHDNHFQDNKYAIFGQDDLSFLCSNNEFINNLEGIYQINGIGTQINYNIFQRNSVAIHLERNMNFTISKNQITQNDIGLHILQTQNSLFTQNTIHDNRWFGLWLINSSHNQIINNTITENIDIGLYIKSGVSNQISHNYILENDDGIYLEYSANNIITNNEFNNIKYNLYFVIRNRQQYIHQIDNNYWERPRILPYLIPGHIKLTTVIIPWFKIDFNPLKQGISSKCVINRGNDGNILYVGGNGPGNFSTIREALNHTLNGDIIYVYNGTYQESLIINKEISLIGHDVEYTIIDGAGISDILILNANNIKISGFTILNGHFGIFINQTNNHLISYNLFKFNLHGISIMHGSSIRINHNHFIDNPYGIRLYYSSNILIEHNMFNNYKQDAFFVGSTIPECKHTWSNNYWREPHSRPVPILGRIRRPIFSLFIFNLDKSPSLEIEPLYEGI
jgi:parallel beta-helix repeat protein